MEQAKKAYLLLANGKVFEGYSFGAQGKTIGEVVFTTGVVGFQETLTDPSYCGQIITQTPCIWTACWPPLPPRPCPPR